MDALRSIELTGILPVIKIEKIEYAVPLAKALRDGGVNAIEVTARNEIAFDAISAIKKNYPDMAVGAGTIISKDFVDRAVDAGAEYCVSPGFNPANVEYCLSKGITMVPGCSSVSDIEIAAGMGLTTLKFFPAEANGGAEALKLINGPFPKVRFVPTGGVNMGNIGQYLKLKCVAACGGSYMAKADLIKAENWEQITQNCRKAMDISLGLEFDHVGINYGNEDDALRSAEFISKLFRLEVKNGMNGIFTGGSIENMKHSARGEKGHFGFKCNSVKRAIAYLESLGIGFIEGSEKRDSSGDITGIWLREELNGFAFHIFQ